MISVFFPSVKIKINAAAWATAFRGSALTERLAVGALILGRIGLMGTHQNPVQSAVVLVVAMICAGLDGAFDALVGIVLHTISSFDLGSGIV